MNGLGLLAQVVHQDVLPEVYRCCEVGFSLADFRDPLDELDEITVRCQHEGVDKDPRLSADRHFLEGFIEDHRIQPEGTLVDSPIRHASSPTVCRQ